MKKSNDSLINKLIPISDFNKEQASKIFIRLQKDKHLIVIKNNLPIGILLSVVEHQNLMQKLYEKSDD
jgi:hypothetical protein